MNWKVEFSEVLEIIILTYEGQNSGKDIYDSSFSTINLSNKNLNNKILVEARNFLSDSTRADIFRLPSELYMRWGMNSSIRIAVIEPKEFSARGLAQFYELACRKLGWKAKIFRDKKKAINWLNE